MKHTIEIHNKEKTHRDELYQAKQKYEETLATQQTEHFLKLNTVKE